jgi:GntR family transcriptional repressor for pyruvate dehydrogenase complex
MSLTRLRPIENLSQVDKIEIRLEEYLKDENFNPGDSLPKEVDIAQALGVSRTAVREAISRFRMLGIIESRKNRGMVITRPDVLNHMERLMDPKLLDGDTMKDIFEMRLVIELGIGEILFLRKTPESLKKLEAIIEKEENTTHRIERLKMDVEFHSMLYRISGNKTILRFQKMLMPIFDYVDSGLTTRQKTLNQNTNATHRDLLEELKHGTPSGFRNKMQSHLRYFIEKI